MGETMADKIATNGGPRSYDDVPKIMYEAIPYERRVELAFEAEYAMPISEFRESLQDIKDSIEKLSGKVEKNYDWTHAIIFGAGGVKGLAAKIQSLEEDRDRTKGHIKILVGFMLALAVSIATGVFQDIGHFVAKLLG
jgi:hypothetical protein